MLRDSSYFLLLPTLTRIVVDPIPLSLHFPVSSAYEV